MHVLLLLPLRNLIAHKMHSLIVGSVILVGTFLAVTGAALVDSVDVAVAKTITASVAGHLQIHSKEAKDDLALFGGGMMGTPDLGKITTFGTVREAVEALPNVKAVVPMGMVMAMTSEGGNEIDKTLEEIRQTRAIPDPSGEAALIGRLRNIVTDLTLKLENTLAIAGDPTEIQEAIGLLRRIDSETFWNTYRSNPNEQLAFLDTALAPLGDAGRLQYFKNIGTDITRFTDLFDRFEIVSGEPIPPGQRGLLISDMIYEKYLKNRVAVYLDRIEQGRRDNELTIKDDPRLRGLAKRLPGQYQRISYELSPDNITELKAKLKKLLPTLETDDLRELLQAFLRVDDANFDQRYRFFYDVIAPMVRLYWADIGDNIILRTVTKAGYVKSINIKVYGVYAFNGLRDSELAGTFNLIDMLTFRELYGVMTEEMQKELETIRQEVAVKDVDQDNIEDALFGDASDDDATADSEAFDAEETIAQKKGTSSPTVPFNPGEIDNGFALNAAVILEDPAQVATTSQAIVELSERKGLGLKVLGWREASGFIGQFIMAARAIHLVMLFIIFLVALVIINNAMVMATMERVGEIGTMRAIGAQRGFVLTIFLMETMILGIIAGVMGCLLGVLVIGYLGETGIPAWSQVVRFFFAGPRLYPTVTGAHLIGSMAVVVVVSLLATLYPARFATRVEPIVAMQTKE